MKTKRHIKEFAGRTLLATLLLLMAQGAKALDVTCGHATWYYSVSANNEVFIDKVTPEAGETSVTMPEIIKGYPVKYANNNLFQGKTQLMQITIKPALEGLSNTHAIGQYFFNGCTSLKNVIFRKLPASFNQHAFNGCTAGVTISFGDGSSVTRTDWENIPGVDNGACFSGCPYAWAMTTDGVIFYFHTDKWPTGLGYNDDQTGKGVLTFDGTLTVDGGYPKSGVYSVFEYKSAINTVIIESGVTTIEDNAFYGCSNLTNLWYIGSKAQWDNISFGENWKEDSGLLNSGIHYLAASGSGTSSDPYIITTEDQWNTLCKYYSEGRLAEGLYYQLGEDISVSTMLGTADRPFVGTFDGSGHTLTFTLDTTEPFAALFRYINGATIQNLRTSGTITTSAKFASGLVSYSKGTNTITNCRSDISINSSVSGDGTHGGFVANI
nr:leucine-rich repeat domain-containing protein [Prevotella sp.]